MTIVMTILSITKVNESDIFSLQLKHEGDILYGVWLDVMWRTYLDKAILANTWK